MFDVNCSPLMARIYRDGIGYAWPDVDISESAESFVFNFEIPGILKDDIKIWIDDDVLTITGEKKNLRDDGQKTLFSDRNFGKFHRSFKLSRQVDKNNVKADFVNGILVVVIPKSQESKKREITIN
jgi:HSP20 family protein